ncbi:MAG TPA: sensor histidine kinase [Terriglobia bacterium]|nr:sensor histidine kinase [Terriglobia bacterium]
MLGDQLIRDPGIAVFELVKNAYDADSPYAAVTMVDIDDRDTGTIIIEDAGTGMDFETVTNIWLEPGTDFRATQKEKSKRTTNFGRLPLGEKGVGRFAAHKLGNSIKLITRSRNRPEIAVKIDWTEFDKHQYLSDVAVRVEERDPHVFRDRQTGTRIEISGLRTAWTKGMVRDLHRSVTSISSPFERAGEFEVELAVPGKEEWLKGLLTPKEVLEFSLFRGHCKIRGRKLEYTYTFAPFPAMDKVEGREESSKETSISLDDPEAAHLLRDHVGPIKVDLYIFDRDPKVLSLGVSDKKGLKGFLDESGGIRVYRDGIRVYDYGEPGNDWLNLDVGRVNIPSERISNNLVLGAVSLKLETSSGIRHAKNTNDENEERIGLIEKTNREGFVENPTFRAFKQAVQFSIAQVAAERNKDKERIRRAYSGKKPKEPVLGTVTELRARIDEEGLGKELGAYLDRIEEDYTAIRDRFLLSASAGLSLMVVIHEVDKAIQELVRAVHKEKASPRVIALAKHIADLIEGLGALARSSEKKREEASHLIHLAMFNTELRMAAHDIKVTANVDRDFVAPCSARLIVSTLMNLLDNSIYWLENRWHGSDARGAKRIYIGTSDELPGGAAIIVADNGSGFSDPPEYLIQPFFTRKPNGMGLGLHLAEQVMKVQGGRLEFPDQGDVKLPTGFDGAVLALVFGGAKWSD